MDFQPIDEKSAYIWSLVALTNIAAELSGEYVHAFEARRRRGDDESRKSGRLIRANEKKRHLWLDIWRNGGISLTTMPSKAVAFTHVL